MKIEIKETFVDKDEDYKIIQKGKIVERNEERAEELINLGFAIPAEEEEPEIKEEEQAEEEPEIKEEEQTEEEPAKEKPAKEEKAVVKTKEEKATKKRK